MRLCYKLSRKGMAHAGPDDLYPDGTNAVDYTGGNNGGAGAGYREYRAYSTEVGQERDESLQVWAWSDSYATQYRNTPSGGEATQAAWSFGGNRTPLVDMPVAGSATYDGRLLQQQRRELLEAL